MATVSAAAQGVALSSSFQTGLSSSRLKASVAAASVGPVRQNGSLKVSASSEERCSRRDAMAVVGGAGLAGLLFLLPAGSAEAARAKPETRRKIREELDKIKEEAVKLTEEGKKSVQGAAKAVSDKVANK
ncbi:hypothetical protein M758_6G107800 [Ceratodon purpureus]|nr:hypothetical protein M758_6G107800 [Ceratodon purpureus]